ncbi:hypothetical protein AK88_01385 [Plasmodium fragile]|uniref:SAC3/GANP/THP3 conserved domain-containing protein n=1 Tax=Plasmodium fragile TaxID=5857 RepID=A0A0D9QTB2_PLAFR|nr:uncharacterized protein AK88_01385 [Plasmodium fragile]KJP88891.1 hypothetical protein AK88_01385 [Plasmodium fragile]
MSEGKRGSIQEEGGKKDGASFSTSAEGNSMYQSSAKEGNNKYLYNNATYGGYGAPGRGLSSLQNFGPLNTSHSDYRNGYQGTYPGGGYANMAYQMGGYPGGGNPSVSYANYQSGNYLYSKNENYFSNFNNAGDSTSYNYSKDCGGTKEVREEEAKKNSKNDNINNDPSSSNVNNDDKYVEMYINKVKEIYYFHVFYHYLKLGYPEKEASMESKKYIFITLSRYFMLVKNAILSSAESIKQINNCVCSNLSYYQQQTNLQEFLLNQQVNLQSMNLGTLNIGSINLPLSDHEKLGDLSKLNSGEVSGVSGAGGAKTTQGKDSTEVQSGANPNSVYNIKADKINNMIDSIEEMKKLNKNKKMNMYGLDEHMSGVDEEANNGLNNASKNGVDYAFNNNEEGKKKISFSLNKTKNKLFQMYNRVGTDHNRRTANEEVGEVRHLGDEGRTNERKGQGGLYSSNSVTMQDASHVTGNNFANMFPYDQQRGRNDGSAPLSGDATSANDMSEKNQMKQVTGLYGNRGRDMNGDDQSLYGNVNYSSYGREQESHLYPNGMNVKGSYDTSNNLLGRMGHRGVDGKEQFVGGVKQRYDGKVTAGDEGSDVEERQQVLQHARDNRLYKGVNDTGRATSQSIRKDASGRYRMQKDGNQDGDYDGDNLGSGILGSGILGSGVFGSGILGSGGSRYPHVAKGQKTTAEEEPPDEVKKCDTFKMYINNIQEEFKEECKNANFSRLLKEFINRLVALNRKRGANTRFWRFNVMPTQEDILSMDVLFFNRRKAKKRYAMNDEDNDMEYGISFSDKKKKLSAEEIESRDRRLEKYGDVSKGKKNDQSDNSFYIDYNGANDMDNSDYITLEKLLDKYNFASCYKNKNFVGLCKSIQKFFFRLTSLPERKNVRSFSVLKCTYAYVLHKYNQDRNYKYINEQFRSMRQCMNIQNIFHDDVINIYETNIRICIVNNDLFQFLQCINKLFELYQRLNIKKSKVEFLCYKLIYLTLQNMHQEFLVEYLTLSDEEKNHENVQLCYYLNECIKNKMYLVNINMVSPLDDEVNHSYIYKRVFINDHILTYLPNLLGLSENRDLNVNLELLIEFVKQHSEMKTEEVECVEDGGVKKDGVKMPYLTNYLIVLFLPKYRLLALINICMTSNKVGISTLTKLLNFQDDETCLSFLEEVNTIMKNNEVISKPSLDNLMKSPLLKNKYINHIR